jgi:drug/metabolite transporter (DMT)-like permease
LNTGSKQRLVAVTALFLGATAIGLAPIFVRLSEVGPSATAFYRMVLALPVIWGWVLLRSSDRAELQDSKSTYRWLIAAGFFFFGDLALWHWSLQFTTVANSTLFTNAAPVFVTLGAYFLFKERIGASLVIGLTVALAGGALLVSESLELSREHVRGDLLAVVTAAFYGGYLLCVKHLRVRTSTSVIMAVSGLVSSPLFLLAAAAANEPLIPKTLYGWGILALLALLSHLCGQGLIAYALAHLPAPFSSVTLLWQPVVAALLAAWILHEPLTVRRVGGGAVVLLGIAIASGLGRLSGRLSNWRLSLLIATFFCFLSGFFFPTSTIC